MTTSRPIPTAPKARSRRGGFTLVEILIAASLSAILLAAVLSSFLFLGRSGTNLGAYNAMEVQARRSLEQFAQDVRQASAITWTSTENITLTVLDASITYELVKNGSDWEFRRNGTALVTGVIQDSFQLIGYTIGGHEIDPDAHGLAGLNVMTKQLQLSLKATRTNPVTPNATNTVLSARFILRNKKVT